MNRFINYYYYYYYLKRKKIKIKYKEENNRVVMGKRIESGSLRKIDERLGINKKNIGEILSYI